MSNYEEDPKEQSYINQISKSLILTDLSISKLESKLAGQRGSNTLNLNDSFIGNEGCIIVSQFLHENISVYNLELRGNNISSEGLRHLGNVFRGQNFIRSISLEWNNIGDGIGALTESLIYSNNLQNLDLRNNRIGPEGASYISKFIENSTSIVKIDLRWNEIGVLGAKKLLSSISQSRSLKIIDLSGNKIPEDLILQIEQQLKGEEKLKKIENKYKTEVRLPRTENRYPKSEDRLLQDDYSRTRSPARIKEFSYNDELYAKYEGQMIANARNEAKINELEILLEQESRKVQEIKNDFLNELDTEKSRRLYSDEALMLYKEEALKKEMDDARTIQELEDKINRQVNEKNMIILELENIQEQYNKFNIGTQDRIRNLEDKLNQQERQNKQNDESYRQVLDKMKIETEQKIYEISREYQNKLEISDENFRLVKNAKENAENEVRVLKNQIAQIKTQMQEALNDQEFRIRDEETIKYNNATRSFESRIKNLEEARDNANKRFNETQKENAINEKRALEQISNLDQVLNVTREEKNDLNGKLQKVTAQKESFANDLFVIKSALDRANIENEQLNKAFKERNDAYAMQLEKICQEHDFERKSFENNKDMLMNQIKSLENDLIRVKRDRERIFKEYEYLAESLKQRVSLMIQDIVLGHMRKLDNE
ncbi:hypothetical protein SteCoe_12611 [Stentor coeruleus]|uniref:Leucine Rich Repeat family protein n=1 Tax=Stentor coeruleus TaxID=5963 RepID=A0A1R2CAE8_9CILI|nr:hypothetical protein SteCoe_12611 [Stentor coeruleus]